MGQCMQDAAVAAKTHPFLGCLQTLQEGEQTLLRLTCPLLNEEDYISWAKNIHKLRFAPEIRDYLYLPVREKFLQAEGMCGSANCLELLFPPYLETLREALVRNIKAGRHFHESFLWYLLFVLLKYIRHCQRKEQPLGSLSLDNLLLFPDGAIKVVSPAILPSHGQASTLLAEIGTSALTKRTAPRSSATAGTRRANSYRISQWWA